MKKAAVLLLVLPFCVAAVPASRPGEKTFVTPELGRIVFQMEAPSDWRIASANNFFFTLVSPPADPGAAYMRLEIAASVAEEKYLARHGWKPDGSVKPEEVLASYVKSSGKYFQDQKTFEQSEGMLAGRKAISQTLGPATYVDPNQKKIPTEGPVLKIYHGITADYNYFNVRLHCHGPQPAVQSAFRQMLPLGERIVASIRRLDVSAMTAEQKARIVPRVHASPLVTISQRRDYYVKMRAQLLLPPGWQAKETTRRPASGVSEKGLYVLDVVPPIEVEADQFAPRITIVMEGLPVGPLSKSDFLQTLGPHVRAILPDHKLLKTESIRLAGMSVLAISRSRYTDPTRSTVVRTFSGQDPYGRTLKIRAYTAGGMTMAAHIILVADAGNYEQILPQIDEVLDLVQIHLRSPSMGLPG